MPIAAHLGVRSHEAEEFLSHLCSHLPWFNFVQQPQLSWVQAYKGSVMPEGDVSPQSSQTWGLCNHLAPLSQVASLTLMGGGVYSWANCSDIFFAPWPVASLVLITVHSNEGWKLHLSLGIKTNIYKAVWYNAIYQNNCSALSSLTSDLLTMESCPGLQDQILVLNYAFYIDSWVVLYGNIYFI